MNKCYSSGFLFKAESVPHFTCPALGVKNVFSTRLGGVIEEGPYSTLDLGAGENESAISENRDRFAGIFGCGKADMLFAKQIHSDIIKIVTKNDLGSVHECDGFVTAEKGIILAVKTADCVPILLSDSVNRVVAAVHAGWRGTASGAVLAALEKMLSLGADIKSISVAIGACIYPCCYEVDVPFKEAFEKSKYPSLVQYISEKDNKGKFSADLPKMNRELLIGYGISKQSIYTLGLCTSCNKEFLFSHRASKGRRGLMMAGIML